MLNCVMVAYGEALDLFQEYILDLHIEAIRRLPQRQQNQIIFDIYADPKSFDKVTKKLWDFGEEITLCIKELSMPPDLKLQPSNWLHGKIIDKNDSGDHLCIICPDWIIPENFYEYIFDNLEYSDNLLTYCPRTIKEGILMEIAGRNAIPCDDLLDYGIRYLHPCQQNLFYESKNFAYWASAVWFSDYSACCFHPHPLVMKLNGYDWPGGSVDGYLTGLFDLSKTHYIQPFEMPIFEFSGYEKTTMATGQSFNEIFFRDFVSKNITARQKHWFSHILQFDPYGSRADRTADARHLINLVNEMTDIHIGPTCKTQSS